MMMEQELNKVLGERFGKTLEEALSLIHISEPTRH